MTDLAVERSEARTSLLGALHGPGGRRGARRGVAERIGGAALLAARLAHLGAAVRVVLEDERQQRRGSP